MPRKVPKEEYQRPAYLSEDGVLDTSKIFTPQPKQTELWQRVYRNGGSYMEPIAPQCMSTGGIRSGKTSGAMMMFIMHYCLKWEGCDMLILRRTFKELESGAIADFKAFMPKELYEYDSSKHVATLYNGSRVVFGHCQNNKERDIEQYLGQAYPAILVDECGQFSQDAWQLLYSRNTVNANCKADEFGNLPTPAIFGCTNPLGPFYEYYRTLFVDRKPFLTGEDMDMKLIKGSRKNANDGTYWKLTPQGLVLAYNPVDYAYQRTTVMDNPALLQRDPGIIQRLNLLPKAKRDKFLLGLDGHFEGQYFDCYDQTYHVINLREDPEQIKWLPYQPVWAGQDWGMGHANATYFFTRALVKSSVGDDWKMKIVCFHEIVVTGGKTYKELATLLAAKKTLPDGTPFKLKSIYFSHEKFARQMDAHAPTVDYTKELRQHGLPAVIPATRDRIGSASYMYNLLKSGELVILDNCREIILAIPGLMRDKDNIDDVLKVDSKGDDCYDGFRYGLWGALAEKKKPVQEQIEDHAKTLDPLSAHFYRLKMNKQRVEENAPFVQEKEPVWISKMRNE